MRRPVALIFAVLIALAAVAGASAAKPTKSKADQASAARDVLTKAELPAGIAWKKATPFSQGSSSSTACAGYNPKTTAVETGQAASRFTAPGLDVDSTAGLLKTAAMATSDWKQSIVPALIPCLRTSFEHGAQGKAKILSLKKLSLTKVAAHTAAYRLLAEVSAKGASAEIGVDIVVFGSSRTELTLSVTADLGTHAEAAKGEADLSALDLYLAERMASKAFAGTA